MNTGFKYLSAAVLSMSIFMASPALSCEVQSIDEAAQNFSGDGDAFHVQMVDDKEALEKSMRDGGAPEDFIEWIIGRVGYIAIGIAKAYPEGLTTVGFFDGDACLITAVHVKNGGELIPKKTGYDI